MSIEGYKPSEEEVTRAEEMGDDMLRAKWEVKFDSQDPVIIEDSLKRIAERLEKPDTAEDNLGPRRRELEIQLEVGKKILEIKKNTY